MMAKPQLQINLFLDPEELLRRIVVWKLQRGCVAVSLSTKDVRRFLGFSSHGLETKVGVVLSKWESEGLVYCVRKRRPKAFMITSRLLEHLFGFDYASLRDKPVFYLSRLEIAYLTLKQIEGEKSGSN